MVDYNPEVSKINKYTHTNTALGYEIGVIYYTFFADAYPVVPWWGILLLLTIGAAVISFIVGSAITLTAAGLTKLFFGRALASQSVFLVAAVIGPILGFLSAGMIVETLW